MAFSADGVFTGLTAVREAIDSSRFSEISDLCESLELQVIFFFRFCRYLMEISDKFFVFVFFSVQNLHSFCILSPSIYVRHSLLRVLPLSLSLFFLPFHIFRLFLFILPHSLCKKPCFFTSFYSVDKKNIHFTWLCVEEE